MARKQPLLTYDTAPLTCLPPDPTTSARENAHVARQIALENAVRRVAYADGESLLRVLWEDSTAAEDDRIEAEERFEREFMESDRLTDIKSDHKAEVLREAKGKVTAIVDKFAKKSGDIDWCALEADLIDALTD